MTELREQLARANAAVKAQWQKYDDAQARGLTGAPLVRIDQKLRRLEDERDALLDRREEEQA